MRREFSIKKWKKCLKDCPEVIEESLALGWPQEFEGKTQEEINKMMGEWFTDIPEEYFVWRRKR